LDIEKITLKTAKKDCSGCSTCASDLEAENLRHALTRLPGVTKVKIDEVTGKVTIEYDTQRMTVSKITERLDRLGYQHEIKSKGIL
jgi:copper chaperone CopZ